MTTLQSLLEEMSISKNPTEVKTIYLKLVKLYHPDHNVTDTTVIMSQINNFFEECLQNLSGATLINNSTKQTYTYQPHSQAAQQFQDILLKLFKFPNIAIELCGSWLWITGDTFSYRKELKSIGCRYSGKKRAWSWHVGSYRKRNKKTFTLPGIRELYGSECLSCAAFNLAIK